MGYNTFSWLIVIGLVCKFLSLSSNALQLGLVIVLPCAFDAWRRICIVVPCMDSFDVLYDAAGEGGGGCTKLKCLRK